MSLVLDPRTTALVLIDLQKGILSQQLAPHALVLFLRTMHGTYVSVNGTLDEVSS